MFPAILLLIFNYVIGYGDCTRNIFYIENSQLNKFYAIEILCFLNEKGDFKNTIYQYILLLFNMDSNRLFIKSNDKKK